MAKKSKVIKAPPKTKGKGKGKMKAGAKTAKRAALNSEQLITQPDFLSLLRSVKNRQREMDEARGSMGNAIKLASDRKHVDKAAFAIFRRLDRMSDNKLAVTVRHLAHYLEIGGVNDRATQQLDAMDEIDPVAKPKRSRAKKEPAVEVPSAVVADAQMDLAERPDLPLN